MTMDDKLRKLFGPWTKTELAVMRRKQEAHMRRQRAVYTEQQLEDQNQALRWREGKDGGEASK